MIQAFDKGAEFRAEIEPAANGQYSAACWAWRDNGSSIDSEPAETTLFDSLEAARAWVEAHAQRRGFGKINWETSPVPFGD